MDLKFTNPFRFVIAGPSCSGKSTLIRDMILNRSRSFKEEPKKIIYFCKHKHSVSQKIKHLVEIRTNFPVEDDFQNSSKQCIWMILDDMQEEAVKSSLISDAFRHARHENISIILVLHNLFSQRKESREISLNMNGVFIMRSVRDLTQIKVLSSQLTPHMPDKLSKIYFNYITTPYSYIFVDLEISQSELFRYRSRVFDSIAVEIFVDQKQLSSLKENETELSNIKVLPFSTKFQFNV